MQLALNELERRVLGVLLEKSLAQPSYYPMTLNAIVAACNQKSNRDPVMRLDEDRVWNTLDALRERGLVARIMAGMSGRVDRFKHEVKDRLGWDKPRRAVMAELLLRGPQTVGELRTRGSRMYPFENVDSVNAVLESLSQLDPPAVRQLPRMPGKAAIRYAHELYLAGEQAWASATETAALPDNTYDSTPVAGLPTSTQVIQQVDQLHGEVAELRQVLTELAQRITALENRD
ncbi:MAG: YceH family protein [Planctomycetota bacterium]